MNEFKCEICYKGISKRAYFVFMIHNWRAANAPKNILLACEKCAILQKLDGHLVSLAGIEEEKIEK